MRESTYEVAFTEFIYTHMQKIKIKMQHSQIFQNKLCALLQFAVVVLLSNTRGQSRAYMIVAALRFDITDQS